MTISILCQARNAPGFAAIGAAIWLILASLAAPHLTMWTLIEVVFLLAPLVLVPMGLDLIERHDGAGGPPMRWARRLLPFGALLAAASFQFPQGTLAGVLALPWACVCALLALEGLRRLWRNGLRPAEGFCFRAALVYLSVGGMALVQSRFGMTPLGFVEPIVLLLAVHYHYTAFAGPIVAGAAGKAMHGRMRRLYPILAWSVIAGTPIVAAGFLVYEPLKIAGTAMLAFGFVGIALATLAMLPRLAPRLSRALLALSSLGIAIGMTLAVVYAWGEVRGKLILGIPFMAWAHAFANGLDFSLCGLLGWTFAVRKEDP